VLFYIEAITIIPPVVLVVNTLDCDENCTSSISLLGKEIGRKTGKRGIRPFENSTLAVAIITYGLCLL
jgi:hypothetical protein